MRTDEYENQVAFIENSRDIKTILKVIASDKKIKNKIQSLLYELYSLSDFRNEIFMLIETFE